MIFKAVRDGRPYPEHGLTMKEWSEIPPRPVRLDQLITTKRELALDRLLAEDSTFYGDLFPHVVQWNGGLYLEDGLHRRRARVRVRAPPGGRGNRATSGHRSFPRRHRHCATNRRASRA